MKSWFALAALAASAFAAAVPATENTAATLLKRVVSPDGTCGGSAGYTCSSTSYKCCSQYGWCGDSAEHCGSGCQSAYGICTGSGGGGSPTTTTTPTSPTGSPSTRPKVGSVPYGQFIYSCTRPGFVALTFDDGPYIYTDALLDLLKANNVLATFFINGQNWGDIITSPEKTAIIHRMIAEGHQIGSHTWDHPDMSTLSAAQITSNMLQLETTLLNIIGKYPTYMRPPFFSCGSTCMNTLNDLGYHVIHSNLDTLDWEYNTPAEIQTSKNIVTDAFASANPATDSFIPLMHDVHETTVYSLIQHVIDTLTARGFRATTVGWCLSDHNSNWYRTAL